MLRTALSPLRFVGWRAVAVAAVVAAVYSAAMAGNGFWGYAAASEISSGECTTNSVGQETCITRFCQEETGGTTRCTTYTTTCTAPNTRGQRQCYTDQRSNTCGSDKSECRPVGDPGRCTTRSDGTETCVSRTCYADGDVVTCQRTEITCTPATTGGTSTSRSTLPPPPPPTSGGGTQPTYPRCTWAIYRETCTTEPSSCGPTGGITGRVREDDGTPIPDAEVRVLTGSGAPVAETTTGADGRYVVGALPPANYRVRFSATGFRTEFFDNAGTLAASDPVGVTESRGATASAKLAVPLGRIEGSVKTESRAPIPTAEVTVLEPDGDVVSSKQVKANGEYRIGALPVGPYVVRFDAPGFATEFFDDAPGFASADPVTVIDRQPAIARARLQP